ncbi:MAG: UDP-N-acetylmuramoyl-tripeptide--D-alanyl-D-alanine ligase [bacterium]|nr:UDP-N-acetylmuramoyl-tripeptide--D-alanyl-D-alanine ligase [bacterium]
MPKSLLLKLLKIFSRQIIKKYQPRIIGITGSIGKSSAKEAVVAVLKTRFNLRGNYKNFNNEIGLPLTIIGWEKSPGRSVFGWLVVFVHACRLLIFTDKNYPEVLVLEMGSDKPGDISYLTGIAPPEVGILTNIGEAHIEAFKTVKAITREKAIIFSRLPAIGCALVNFDNAFVMEAVLKIKAKVITYGFNKGADFQATDIKIVTDATDGWPVGINFKLIHAGSVVPIFLPGQIAEYLIYSVLAGVAAGSVFGMNLVSAGHAVSGMKLLPGHMCLVPGIKKTLIIDDTYNSSPEAVKSALVAISKIQLATGARHYAVLGDMLELGEATSSLHREIGFKVAESSIDFLITIGEAGKHTAAAAREAGLSDNQVASFATSSEAGKFLQEKLKAGDVVLVKGSQGIRAEKVVKEVMAEPLLASALLARQGVEWRGI